MEFTAWVAEVLDAARRLPGLVPNQCEGTALQWAECVGRVACERLAPLLSDPRASWSDVYAATTQLVREVEQHELPPARQLMERQLRGLRTLQRISAASVDGRNDEAGTLFVHSQNDMAEALTPLPIELAQELTGARARGVVLTDQITYDLLWIKLHDRMVSEACAAALQLLPGKLALPDNAPQWHGVGVLRGDNSPLVQAACRTAGSQGVVQCPPCALVLGLEQLVLVSVASAADRSALLGLRLARAIHAIFEEAARATPPWRPAWWITPDDDDDDRLADDLVWDEELQGNEPVMPLGPPREQLIANLKLADQVDRTLQRDYVVLCVFVDELETVGAVRFGTVMCLPIAHIIARLHTLDGSGCDAALAVVRGHTMPSLQQVVGHVLNKSVRRSAGGWRPPDAQAASRADLTEMRYGRLPGAAPGCKGVMLTTERARLRLLTDSLPYVVLMRGDSIIFQYRWFPSRSAKSHARRRRAAMPT